MKQNKKSNDIVENSLLTEQQPVTTKISEKRLIVSRCTVAPLG